jgi:hypothetical protein
MNCKNAKQYTKLLKCEGKFEPASFETGIIKLIVPANVEEKGHLPAYEDPVDAKYHGPL